MMTTFVISSSELSAKLEKLSKVINTKNTLPILDNFLFKGEKNTLTITASDMENIIQTTIGLNDSFDGIFAVDAKMLLTALKELPEQPLTFEFKKKRCVIRYMKGHFSIPTAIEPENYPCTMSDSFDNYFSVDGTTMSRILKKTVPFVGMDELRPILSGVCLDLDEKERKLYAAASNGHQLVKLTESVADLKGQGRVVVHFKTAKLMESFVSQNEEMTVSYNNRYLLAETTGFKLYSRLVEGKYPNYNSIIPTDYTDYVEVERKNLLNVIRRVSIMSDNASKLVKYELKGFELKLSCEDIDFSRGAEEFMEVTKCGKDITFGLKSEMTINILNSIGSDSVKVEYKYGTSAIIFRQTDDSENQLYLQMPMMVY